MKQMICIKKLGPWKEEDKKETVTEDKVVPMCPDQMPKKIEIPEFLLDWQEQRYQEKLNQKRLRRKQLRAKKLRRIEITHNIISGIKFTALALFGVIGVWAWAVLLIILLG